MPPIEQLEEDGTADKADLVSSGGTAESRASDALTAVRIHEIHRLPDVRNALLDYADTPCDDTAFDLIKLVAEHIDRVRSQPQNDSPLYGA